MKQYNKIAAILLAVALLMSLLPSVAAEPAAKVTTVIACSDFQNPSGDTAGKTFVKSVLAKMQSNGILTADGFLCCGDYCYNDSNTTSALLGHINSLKSAVETYYGSELNEVFVQGNHDKVAQGTGGLSGPGAHDTNDYGVYVIDEDDYMWYNDNPTRIAKTADSLSDYLFKKQAYGYEKPIFVVSHLPLHYSNRTKRDGDGKNANLIFDVLNEAAGNGLNIIYLYGHDHSHGWDNYLGGAAVYLKKGDTIYIAQGNKNSAEAQTLNFTYMNAGFTGYYEAHGADNTLTMTVFQISDDTVTVSRYSKNGVYNLKSAGVWNGEYDDSTLGYPRYTDTVSSPQTITLTEVTPVPAITVDGSVISSYAVDRGMVSSLTLDVLNFSGAVTWSSSNDEIAEVANGVVTFPGEPGNVTVTAENGTEKATVTLKVTDSVGQRIYTKITSTSEIESGKKYLIICNDTSTPSFMIPDVVTRSTGSGPRTGFDLVTTEETDTTITGTDYVDWEWTLVSTEGGYYLTNADGEQTKFTDVSGGGITATLEESGDVFTVAGSSGAFTFTSGSTVLNYNGTRNLINGYGSNAAKFTLYKLTAEEKEKTLDKGDLNGDKKVDAYDLTILARLIGGIETSTNKAFLEAADWNGDKVNDALDLTTLARHVAQID